MPGKYTEGYTKDAQKSRFIRHRDIKMKDGELKREAHIQKVMCEGVCRRCREKAQWRFRYDKYKPLKNVANCQGCKQKCVTKAYRTLCDKCAQKKGVCPGCCGSLDEPESEAATAENAGEDAVESQTPSEVPTTVFQALHQTSSSTTTAAAAEPAVDMPGASTEGENMDVEDEEEEEEEDDEEEDDNEANEEEDGEEMDESLLSRDINDAPNWNEKKFKNIAASKYSKQRKVGSDSDVTYY